MAAATLVAAQDLAGLKSLLVNRTDVAGKAPIISARRDI